MSKRVSDSFASELLVDRVCNYTNQKKLKVKTQSVAVAAPDQLSDQLDISSKAKCHPVAVTKAQLTWGVLQELKVEKERLERERKLKQKQKAKERARSEKEKLAAEKEAAERETRERSEEQLRLQEQQSIAARSATLFVCQCCT